jgi:acyl carrier protein
VTSSETGVDIQFRQRLLDAMVSLLTRLLEPDKPVTPDMRLMDELGLSSSLALELLLELEEQLQIQIDVELMDQDQMTTVEDLATFIAGHSRPM